MKNLKDEQRQIDIVRHKMGLFLNIDEIFTVYNVFNISIIF